MVLFSDDGVSYVPASDVSRVSFDVVIAPIDRKDELSSIADSSSSLSEHWDSLEAWCRENDSCHRFVVSRVATLRLCV